MRILICGGREYDDRARLNATLSRQFAGVINGVIIEGGSTGADELAREWGFTNRVRVQSFTADVARFGASAISSRHQDMIDIGRPTLVLAFPYGAGTADVVRRALWCGIPVMTVEP